MKGNGKVVELQQKELKNRYELENLIKNLFLKSQLKGVTPSFLIEL